MRKAMSPLERTVRPRLRACGAMGLARAEAFCLALVSLSSFRNPNRSCGNVCVVCVRGWCTSSKFGAAFAAARPCDGEYICVRSSVPEMSNAEFVCRTCVANGRDAPMTARPYLPVPIVRVNRRLALC